MFTINTASLRKPRLLIAAAIICVLLFAGHFFDAPRKTQQWASDLTKAPPPRPFNVGTAHTIATADGFLPHFATVMTLPPLSVAEAKSTCTWGEDENPNYMFGNDIPWNVKPYADTDAHVRRAEWQDFVKNGMVPYSRVQSKFKGKGMVVVAGNYDSMMRVRVMFRQLTRLKSTIMVEIHYWGDEIDEATMKEIKEIYPRVTFNDLEGAHNLIRITRKPFKIPNFQFKTGALLNSHFAEPMLVDADNVPYIQPELLFVSQAYEEYGTVFWPDIARTRPSSPAWAITNTPCKMDEYEVESGQLMVDKRRFWYHLQLTHWMLNDQIEHYSNFILGDKDCFRFAWHALKTKYGRPWKWLTSIGTAHGGKSYCGHTFGQHHPDYYGGIAFLHGGLVKTVDDTVLEWNRKQTNGYYNAYKRSPTDDDASQLVNVTIRFEDGKEYMPEELHAGIKHGFSCTDMRDIEAGDSEEIIPGFAAAWDEIGGYFQLDPDYVQED